MEPHLLEADFVAAAASEQLTHGVAEICAVLNRLPAARLHRRDADTIDAVDALMDDLYRARMLRCPGHRWLPESPPSIRGHLARLYESGAVLRDPATGRWHWDGRTSYFTVA